MADGLEHQEKQPEGKTEHLCVQVSVTDLKQLPSTNATYSNSRKYTSVCIDIKETFERRIHKRASCKKETVNK